MSYQTIATCDGCGAIKVRDYRATENPDNWGYVSVEGSRAGINAEQLEWVNWRNKIGSKLYCQDCLTAMTGVPMP